MATAGRDKFAGVDWYLSSQGLPGLCGAIARLECVTEMIHPAGDHDVVIAAVTTMDAEEDRGGPLVFFRGSYGRFFPFD
jgi:3-hydroxy-9,10-secoandrosta-1,3,5(10)-triene-9,17-dione monooxygenase reductase component